MVTTRQDVTAELERRREAARLGGGERRIVVVIISSVYEHTKPNGS